MLARATDVRALAGVVLVVGCHDPIAGASSEGGSSSATSSGPGLTTSEEPTGASGGEATTVAELPECPPIEDRVSFDASLEPCADPACANVTLDGFMPVGFEVGGELYADLAFECEVQDVVGSGVTLGGCVGEGAPASGAVRAEFSGDRGATLPLVPGEHVRVTFHGGTNQGNEHRSWSIRRDDDSPVVLVSLGLWLPPAEVADPFELVGSPHPCGTGPLCGGYSRQADLRITLDGTSVWVPSGEMGVLTTNPPHTVLVSHANFAGPYSCGVFSWTETYYFAVLASP